MILFIDLSFLLPTMFLRLKNKNYACLRASLLALSKILELIISKSKSKIKERGNNFCRKRARWHLKDRARKKGQPIIKVFVGA